MAFSKKVEPHVVLDLGSHSIKVLLGIYDGYTVKVKKAFRVEMPDGAYYDGRISEPVTVATLIKNALKDHGIKEKKCIVTFNSKDVIQREMTVPQLSYEDTVGLIRFEISQYLPIEVDEYDIAYKTLSKKTIKENNHEEEASDEENNDIDNVVIISYVVKKDLVEELHAMIMACGLEPVYLDFHSNSISKFVKHIKGRDSRRILSSGEHTTVALIDLGHKNILIDIVEDNNVVLSRNVDMGFLDQDVLISKSFGVDLKEAERIRQEKFSNRMVELYYIYEKIKNVAFDSPSLTKETLGIGVGAVSEEDKKLFAFLADSMLMYDEAVSEISKVLQYYTNRSSSNKIDRVLLYGASVTDSSVLEFFNMLLDFQVEAINFDRIPNISFAGNVTNKGAYVNALGALIRFKEA